MSKATPPLSAAAFPASTSASWNYSAKSETRPSRPSSPRLPKVNRSVLGTATCGKTLFPWRAGEPGARSKSSFTGRETESRWRGSVPKALRLTFGTTDEREVNRPWARDERPCTRHGKGGSAERDPECSLDFSPNAPGSFGLKSKLLSYPAGRTMAVMAGCWK